MGAGRGQGEGGCYPLLRLGADDALDVKQTGEGACYPLLRLGGGGAGVGVNPPEKENRDRLTMPLLC